MCPSRVPSFDAVVFGVKEDKCDDKSFLQYSSPNINLIRDSFAVVNFSQLSSDMNAPVIKMYHKIGHGWEKRSHNLCYGINLRPSNNCFNSPGAEK
jgi:hypothetical protein